jgi:hypothetical protein
MAITVHYPGATSPYSVGQISQIRNTIGALWVIG